VPDSPASAAPQAGPAVPRDVVVLLVQLSVALNKTRAYPAGHPVLSAAVDVLVQQLVGLLDRRPALTLGVTARELIVEGAATDPDHPVLRDLAGKLHHHQLAGIRILRGVQVDEVDALLRMLAEESWRQGRPAGLIAADWEAPPWEHIHLEPLPLDQLTLADPDAPASAERQAEQLWRGLAVAVLGIQRDQAETVGVDPASPSAVAALIRQRAEDGEFARSIVEWLFKADAAAAEAGPDSPVAGRVESLIEAMGPDALARIVTLGAEPQRRRSLALAASRSLPVGAVLEVLQAAQDPEHGLSHAMLRILGKLGRHSHSVVAPALPGADAALRDSVRHLLGEWEGETNLADPYRRQLELLSRPLQDPHTPAGGRGVLEAARLVYMGLELGIAPASVARAVADLTAEADAAFLLELYEGSRGRGPTADLLHERLAEPKFLTPVLMRTEDDELRTRFVNALGARAIEPLLDALEVAEEASKRRWILDRLGPFGDDLGPAIVARLPGKPWYVQRNLLGLLGTLPALPAAFDPGAYATHVDPRVRREAYKLLLSHPDHRGPAVTRAASDPDDGIARLALSAAAEECPPALSAKLLDLARNRYRDPDLRAQAIRLLGRRPTPAAGEWLAGLVLQRGWLGRRRLAPKSPDVLAALGVLGRLQECPPEAARALRLARASRDPEVRTAVAGPGRERQG